MSQDYQVLARKYRPSKFAELLGQDALVQTVQNSIRLGKVAHAFMLTGVRGVGKTTTARIIAKVLNCDSAKDGEPVSEPCNACEQCKAISEDRHLDVLELDAASNTGIDNIRELTESAGYKPSIGRTKVYILDEVHMLSNQAFNGLLKTLEEPPPHVVFILATTDIDKVPVTILSRCQRFDLARVKMEVLQQHFKNICESEKLTINDEALHLLAVNAEGSVRDGLSLLEQAAAISGGDISNDTIRNMLGLADKEVLLDMFDLILKADAAGVLGKVAELDNLGVDALQIIKDLLDLNYNLTRIKLVPDTLNNMPELQKVRSQEMTEKLSVAALSRIWQVLFKGFNDVKSADNRRQALEMVLIRLLYLAETPTAEEMLKAMQGGGGAVAPQATATATPAPAPTPTAAPQNSPAAPPPPWEEAEPATEKKTAESASIDITEDLSAIKDIVAKYDPELAAFIYSGVHLVSLEGCKMTMRLRDGVAPSLIGKMQKILKNHDGKAWEIEISSEQGSPTLSEQKKQKEKEIFEKAENDSMVLAVKNHFSSAKTEEIKIRQRGH